MSGDAGLVFSDRDGSRIDAGPIDQADESALSLYPRLNHSYANGMHFSSYVIEPPEIRQYPELAGTSSTALSVLYFPQPVAELVKEAFAWLLKAQEPGAGGRLTAEQQARRKTIGVKIETHDGALCILTLYYRGRCVIVNSFRHRFPDPSHELANMDRRWLFAGPDLAGAAVHMSTNRDFNGFRLHNAVDLTSTYAHLSGKKEQPLHLHQAMKAVYDCGMAYDRRVAQSDWSAQRLSLAQVKYCAVGGWAAALLGYHAVICEAAELTAFSMRGIPSQFTDLIHKILHTSHQLRLCGEDRDYVCAVSLVEPVSAELGGSGGNATDLGIGGDLSLQILMSTADHRLRCGHGASIIINETDEVLGTVALVHGKHAIIGLSFDCPPWTATAIARQWKAHPASVIIHVDTSEGRDLPLDHVDLLIRRVIRENIASKVRDNDSSLAGSGHTKIVVRPQPGAPGAKASAAPTPATVWTATVANKYKAGMTLAMKKENEQRVETAGAKASNGAAASSVDRSKASDPLTQLTNSYTRDLQRFSKHGPKPWDATKKAGAGKADFNNPYDLLQMEQEDSDTDDNQAGGNSARTGDNDIRNNRTSVHDKPSGAASNRNAGPNETDSDGDSGSESDDEGSSSSDEDATPSAVRATGAAAVSRPAVTSVVPTTQSAAAPPAPPTKPLLPAVSALFQQTGGKHLILTKDGVVDAKPSSSTTPSSGAARAVTKKADEEDVDFYALALNDAVSPAAGPAGKSTPAPDLTALAVATANAQIASATPKFASKAPATFIESFYSALKSGAEGLMGGEARPQEDVAALKKRERNKQKKERKEKREKAKQAVKDAEAVKASAIDERNAAKIRKKEEKRLARLAAEEAEANATDDSSGEQAAGRRRPVNPGVPLPKVTPAAPEPKRTDCDAEARVNGVWTPASAKQLKAEAAALVKASPLAAAAGESAVNFRTATFNQIKLAVHALLRAVLNNLALDSWRTDQLQRLLGVNTIGVDAKRFFDARLHGLRNAIASCMEDTAIDACDNVSRGLNESQKQAVVSAHAFKVVGIHGPPGTGKTKCIAALARSFAMTGKRTLIVTPAIAATKQVLEALVDDGCDDAALIVCQEYFYQRHEHTYEAKLAPYVVTPLISSDDDVTSGADASRGAPHSNCKWTSGTSGAVDQASGRPSDGRPSVVIMTFGAVISRVCSQEGYMRWITGPASAISEEEMDPKAKAMRDEAVDREKRQQHGRTPDPVTEFGAFVDWLAAFRTIDVAIIDEASQLWEGYLVNISAALPSAEKLVLVGDQHQLPPFGEDKTHCHSAFEAVMGHPSIPITLLNVTYRLPPAVTMLLSTSFYGGRIDSQHDDWHAGVVANKLRWACAFEPRLKTEMGVIESLPDAIEGNPDHPDRPTGLIWCDYAVGDSYTGADAKSAGNEAEARFIARLASRIEWALQRGGHYNDKQAEREKNSQRISKEITNMVVITGFEEQRSKIEKFLAEERAAMYGVAPRDALVAVRSNKSVTTIDGYQGQEADIVIVSLVKRNNALGFLADNRKCNVMLSRCKACMAVVGDHRNFLTVAKASILRQLAEYCLINHLVRDCTKTPLGPIQRHLANAAAAASSGTPGGSQPVSITTAPTAAVASPPTLPPVPPPPAQPAPLVQGPIMVQGPQGQTMMLVPMPQQPTLLQQQQQQQVVPQAIERAGPLTAAAVVAGRAIPGAVPVKGADPRSLPGLPGAPVVAAASIAPLRPQPVPTVDDAALAGKQQHPPTGLYYSQSQSVSAPQGIQQLSASGWGCPSCHNGNPATNKFCGECGSPAPVVRCPACAKEVPYNNNFCGDCGAQVQPLAGSPTGRRAAGFAATGQLRLRSGVGPGSILQRPSAVSSRSVGANRSRRETASEIAKAPKETDEREKRPPTLAGDAYTGISRVPATSIKVIVRKPDEVGAPPRRDNPSPTTEIDPKYIPPPRTVALANLVSPAAEDEASQRPVARGGPASVYTKKTPSASAASVRPPGKTAHHAQVVMTAEVVRDQSKGPAKRSAPLLEALRTASASVKPAPRVHPAFNGDVPGGLNKSEIVNESGESILWVQFGMHVRAALAKQTGPIDENKLRELLDVKFRPKKGQLIAAVSIIKGVTIAFAPHSPYPMFELEKKVSVVGSTGANAPVPAASTATPPSAELPDHPVALGNAAGNVGGTSNAQTTAAAEPSPSSAVHSEDEPAAKLAVVSAPLLQPTSTEAQGPKLDRFGNVIEEVEAAATLSHKQRRRNKLSAAADSAEED